MKLTFGGKKLALVGYIDLEMVGDHLDNSKSTSGYLMTFAGGAVTWQSKLQKCGALFTTKTSIS